jgi:hypothetical protein
MSVPGSYHEGPIVGPHTREVGTTVFASSRSTKPVDADWTGDLKVTVTLAVIDTRSAPGPN